MDGASTLAASSVFRWPTFGFPLEGRISEFVPVTRIGWFGYGPGASPTVYHASYLQAQSGGCLVVTDEVGKGKRAKQIREKDEGLIHRAHDLWLAGLRWISERC
jgi:hypothetical protein